MKIILKKLTSFFASIPSVGAALLPACPLCTTALAGLLSSVGLGAVNYSPYLLPLTIGFLLIALIALFFTGKARKDYRSFILGILGAAFILIGKFWLKNNIMNYTGIGLLIIASLWNAWPGFRIVKGKLEKGGVKDGQT